MKSFNNYINSLKLSIKIKKIQYLDKKNDLYEKMELTKCFAHDMPLQFELKQPIKIAAYFENKCHNIRLTTNKINGIIIKEGQLFSFWKIVGNPSLKNGFKIGRSLKNGKLFPEVGGGICQSACILYHSALSCGLEIVERYNHSMDIYTEEERFTPLGADSTVVYGNKDLRFRNPYPFDLILGIEIYENELICRIYSRNDIPLRALKFERNYLENRVEVTTLENEKPIVKSIYLLNK